MNRAAAVVSFAQAIRLYGHLNAQLDPLGSERPGDPELSPEYHGISYAEMQDFLECCASGRRPQSGALVAHDTVAALYAGYVSAERKGADVAVPVAPVSDVE